MKIVFSIVLFGQKYSDCVSFKTLIKSFLSERSTDEKLSVIIYDNTPSKISNDTFLEYCDGVNLFFFSKGLNLGLPRAYNYVCEKAGELDFEKIVFLDQDTELPIDSYYIYRSISSDTLVACPKVYTKYGLMSPAYYSNYRSKVIMENLHEELHLKGVSCINSGLFLDLKVFTSVNGYNEQLFLDFCDHDFIERVYCSGVVSDITILNLDLKQDFSAITHNKEQAINRYKLFVKDIKIYAKNRNRFKIFILVDMPHLLKLIYKYKCFDFINIRFFKI